jgi:hypothetical protein
MATQDGRDDTRFDAIDTRHARRLAKLRASSSQRLSSCSRSELLRASVKIGENALVTG